MNSFKNSLAVFAGIVLVVFTIALVTPRGTQGRAANTASVAGDAGLPVKVVNGPSDPVPVTGTINVGNLGTSPLPVTGTVNVGNSPLAVTGTVNVGNLGASPLPVRDVDHPARQRPATLKCVTLTGQSAPVQLHAAHAIECVC